MLEKNRTFFFLNVVYSRYETLRDVGFEVFAAVTIKNAVLWDVAPCGSCKETDISEERVTPMFRVEEIMRATKCWSVANRLNYGLKITE